MWGLAHTTREKRVALVPSALGGVSGRELLLQKRRVECDDGEEVFLESVYLEISAKCTSKYANLNVF